MALFWFAVLSGRAARGEASPSGEGTSMLRHWCGVIVSCLLAGSVQAGSWADGLFTELNKDFGSVPRGPMLSHPFHVKNNLPVPVHIQQVRVSCGCVTATAMANRLMPGEETAVLAQMNTTRFEGIKTVTIFVTIDEPQYAEVRLWVQANSREDVSVTPDTINFGQIKRGSSPSAAINVVFLGGSQWQVTGVSCESNYVKPALREIRRQGYEVDYQLTAQLRADVPVGRWYTDIWLKTNNPATPRVRVPLNVEVESALTVSPPIVDLGQVKIGGQAQRKVIVRGIRPFRITEVKGTDAEIAVRDTAPDSRPVHVLAITLKGDSPGDVKRQLRIQTDLREEGEIELQAKAQIVP
jgi:hypothetical protein